MNFLDIMTNSIKSIKKLKNFMTDQIIKRTLFHWLLYISYFRGKAREISNKGGCQLLKGVVVVGCILNFSVYGSTILFDAASPYSLVTYGIVHSHQHNLDSISISLILLIVK